MASTSLALSALKQLPIARSTLVANEWRARPDGVWHAERLLFERGPEHRVTIPHDERLAGMLDTGTYTVDALGARRVWRSRSLPSWSAPGLCEASRQW